MASLTPATLPGVTAAALAVFLAVSVRHVFRLALLPGFPASVGPGRYDLYACGVWYIKHQRMSLDQRGSTAGSATLRAEKLRLLTGQAEAVETANRVRAGELLEMDSVGVLWGKRVTNCQRRLRAIPSSIGPSCVSKSASYCESRLNVAINEALTELDGPAGGDKKPRRDRRRRHTP